MKDADLAKLGNSNPFRGVCTPSNDENKMLSVTIPIELHQKMALYNKISVRQINMTRVCQRALEQEADKIDLEVIEKIKARGKPVEILDGSIFMKLSEYINTNPDNLNGAEFAIALHSAYIRLWGAGLNARTWMSSGIKSRFMEDLSVCLPLYPIDRFEVKSEEEIAFFAGDVHCYSVKYKIDEYLEILTLSEDMPTKKE